MPRARQVDLLKRGVDRPWAHPLGPVGEVAIGDRQRHRRAECAAVADARGRLRGVMLDLHPPAATVTELPARHVAIDRVAVQLEAGRKPLEHAGETRAVRLPGGDHAQQRHRLLSLVSARDWD